MKGNLASLLFGSHRRDALALLLLHPEDSLHVREIGRITAKAPGTMLRELNRLADAGVLLRRRVGNQVQFRANATCPIYEDLRNILEKTTAHADAPRDGRARERDLLAKAIKPQLGSYEKPSGRGERPAEAQPTLHSTQASYGFKPVPAKAKPPAQKLRISQAKLEALCRKYGIAKLSVFGSASRNELTTDSDVDLMVEFSPDSRASLFDITVMQDEFSAAFGGREVDIATPDILRNPFGRESILPDLKPIYET